jgi:3-oxoacyl-[acyl-carrier protein] reductase
MDVALWDEMIATHLRGTFLMTRFVLPGMLERGGGRIINLSSQLGQIGRERFAHYAAAKAGIIGFTKSLARELGSRGVRANVIAPGYVHSRLTDEISDEMRNLMLQNTPLGRLGEPEDIAGAVRFLCSDAAAYITGEVLLVDGGLGM